MHLVQLQAIGFLGAGVIFVKKDNIVGVTTAAGLWATVGIGLTIGSGLYVLGISCTALIILIQLIVHRGEHKSFSTNNGSIQINLTKNNLSINDAREKLEAMGLILKNISLAKNTDNQIILSASIISVGDVSTTEVVNNLQSMDFIDMIEIYSLD